MNQSRGEKRSTQGLPVPRGGFHKAGEGPAFGGSLVTFCPIRKSPQRSVPGWGAGFHRGNRRRASPAGCPLSRGRKQKYNNGLPWTSTAGHEVVEAAPYHSARRICAQILHPDEARLRGNTLCIAAKPQRNLGGTFPQSLADAMVRCSLSAFEGCRPQPCGGWARCRWNRCSHQPRPGARRG